MSTCFYLRAGKKTKNNNTREIQIYAAAELMFDTFFAEIKAQMSPSFPPFSFFFFFLEKRARRWTSSHRSAILLNRQKRSGGEREKWSERRSEEGREGIRGKVDEMSEKRR